MAASSRARQSLRQALYSLRGMPGAESFALKEGVIERALREMGFTGRPVEECSSALA